ALVQQHVLLVEAVQAALDDLGQGLLGFALVLGGLLRDAALVLDDVGGHLVTVEVGGEKAAMCMATSRATSAPAASVATSTPTCGGRSLLVRCMLELTTSPETRPMRRTRHFSPMLAPALVRASPKAVSARSAGSSAPDSTAAATASSPRATNLSFLATKSVSEFSSTRVPVWPPSLSRTSTAMRPSDAVRPSRLATP